MRPLVSTLPPNRAYYQSTHGRWRSALELRITDWRAFRACPMTLLDRFRVLSMLATAAVLGPLVIETEVDYHGHVEDGEVLHRTRVGKWGMTLMRSEERFVLDDDGHAFEMRGELRMAPTFLARGFGDATGRIDETGTRGRYEFDWLGTRMRQTTRLDARGAEITQETDWSRGVQMLRRIPGG